MNRRIVLKTLALGAGASALDLTLRGAAGAIGQTDAPEGGTPVVVPPSGPFTLPPLPYPADALEPHLDAQTMTLHHDKHHAAYVTNLNKAVSGKKDLESRTVEDLLAHLSELPDDARPVVRNHGGGHYNHTLLWTSLKKGGAPAPSAELAKAMDDAFGGFERFQRELARAALGVFGSGWAWLSFDAAAGLRIETTPNQDSPLTAGRTPLLGVDVWEHAYYLKFHNRRMDYIAEFAKVVDWDVVAQRYLAAAAR
jgi:Fe-Mn family superoxide dismutase